MAHSPEWASIVVADNASTDASLEYVHQAFPRIRTIALDRNYGFAGGYNRALQQVEAQYYIILNSDVEVTAGWLDKLVAHMDAMPFATAAMPRIRDYTRREYFEYAGAAGGFIDRNGYPFCRGRIFSTCERDIGQHEDTREVFWASGACIIIRAQAFHDVGGFDESLFAHMEEIDLCWRLKNRGHRIYCFPDVKVFHLGGGTLAQTSPKKTFLNFRNNLVIITKNDHRKRLTRILLKRLLLDALGGGYLLLTRGPSHLWAVVRAHFSFYKALPRALRQRKQLIARAVPTRNSTGLYRESIVRNYFMDGKKVFGALESRYFIRLDRIESEGPGHSHALRNH